MTDSCSGQVWRSDVLVVGAGPAGVAAAIEACHRGLTAVVIDKARFPRDKCCGDGLTTGALRQLDQLGLDPSTLPSWRVVDEVTVVGPRGRTARFPLPSGPGTFGAVCRRRELDAALVALARQAGAAVLEGVGLDAVEQGGQPGDTAVVARAGGQRFEARHLVAADGMWSPTRKLVGAAQPGYRGEWHALRQYVAGVSGAATRDLLVWFEPDLLPGYAWSFPLADGSANVGFGILRGSSGYPVGDLGAVWTDLLARPHIAEALGPGATPEGPVRAWPIPARLPTATVAQGRVLFVGDAATATDPMTGEGIGQALETGRAAARAVAEAGAATDAAERYRSHLAATMVVDHRLAQRLSRVLEHPRGASAAIAIAGATGWTRANFGRWLFEDYPRAVLVTPRRWPGHLRTRAGAFARTR